MPLWNPKVTLFKRSLVISCHIRAWLGLVHTFQATNGFLLRTLGTKSTDLACTHFVRTLYALYTHFQRHFEKLKVALWDFKVPLWDFKVPLLNFKVHFEDRKRFYII